MNRISVRPSRRTAAAVLAAGASVVVLTACVPGAATDFAYTDVGPHETVPVGAGGTGTYQLSTYRVTWKAPAPTTGGAATSYRVITGCNAPGCDQVETVTQPEITRYMGQCTVYPQVPAAPPKVVDAVYTYSITAQNADGAGPTLSKNVTFTCPVATPTS